MIIDHMHLIKLDIFFVFLYLSQFEELQLTKNGKRDNQILLYFTSKPQTILVSTKRLYISSLHLC